jgi:hypothetical protein
MSKNENLNFKKIAFCFLTYKDIIGLEVWNQFFKNIDTNKYTVYIHPKNSSLINLMGYQFPINVVKNIINTRSKTDISIVRATLQLLKECYLENIENKNQPTHYVFLSQSCIPLYNFETLYKIITKTDKSIISYIQNNRKDRYYQIHSKLHQFINYSNFVKQQPNMILVKEDVEILIKQDLTPYFAGMECPDEHYFINILLYVFRKKIIKQQTHFCNPDLNKTQALEFTNINKLFINNVRSKLFLFMRKVSNNGYIDIKYLLNNIGNQINTSN